MAIEEEMPHEGAQEAGMRPAQRAWCVLMLLVMVASATVLAVFIDKQLHPASEPVLRLPLADLTPRPGFGI